MPETVYQVPKSQEQGHCKGPVSQNCRDLVHNEKMCRKWGWKPNQFIDRKHVWLTFMNMIMKNIYFT